MAPLETLASGYLRQYKHETGACVYVKLLATGPFLGDKDYLVYSSFQMMDKTLHNINPTVEWGALSINNVSQAKQTSQATSWNSFVIQPGADLFQHKTTAKAEGEEWCPRASRSCLPTAGGFTEGVSGFVRLHLTSAMPPHVPLPRRVWLWPVHAGRPGDHPNTCHCPFESTFLADKSKLGSLVNFTI